jgi:hypothetical protein
MGKSAGMDFKQMSEKDVPESPAIPKIEYSDFYDYLQKIDEAMV